MHYTEIIPPHKITSFNDLFAEGIVKCPNGRFEYIDTMTIRRLGYEVIFKFCAEFTIIDSEMFMIIKSYNYFEKGIGCPYNIIISALKQENPLITTYVLMALKGYLKDGPSDHISKL